MIITKVKTYTNGFVKRHYIMINSNDKTFQIYYDWDKEAFELDENEVDLKWLKSSLTKLAKLYIPVATLEVLERHRHKDIDKKTFEELMRYHFNIHNDGENYYWGYGQNKTVLISINDFKNGYERKIEK